MQAGGHGHTDRHGLSGTNTDTRTDTDREACREACRDAGKEAGRSAEVDVGRAVAAGTVSDSPCKSVSPQVRVTGNKERMG